MSAEVQTTPPLTKVDSAIDDAAPASPTESKIRHRRTSSTVSGVFNINELESHAAPSQMSGITSMDKAGLTMTARMLNKSPNTVDDPSVLKKLLCTPPIKKIDLRFPLGLEVTARNLKGVTIKDALDAIHKQFKKKSDDELDSPYLAGFEWDKEECYTRFIVHQKKTGDVSTSGGSKKKNKKGEDKEAS